MGVIDLNELKTHEDIIDAFEKLKEKAREIGKPICLNTTTSTELVLYYHDDYEDRILVDKYLSDLANETDDIQGNVYFPNK